jgi:hypothetical protein
VTISGNLGDDVGAGFYSNDPGSLRFVTITNKMTGADSPTAGAGINAFPSGAGKAARENRLMADSPAAGLGAGRGSAFTGVRAPA